MTSAFRPIADSLRREVERYYTRRGTPIADAGARSTLATNSVLAERRGALIASLLAAQPGAPDLRGARLLDVGCGFGALSVFFSSLGADVTGVDVNGERMEVGAAVALEHGLQARFARSSMDRLDAVADASFDVAVVNNSLCYLTTRVRRIAALAEIGRTLRPGGWVIVRDPNRTSARDPFTGLPLLAWLPMERAQEAARRLHRPRSKVFLASERGAMRELERAGFTGVRVAVPQSRRWRLLHRVARYHHVVGRRPAS